MKNISDIRTLVIDDSETIRHTATNLLSHAGCSVFTATDGFSAFSKIIEHQPHIIFLDVMMPRLDGYQVCALIKSNEAFREIPVVLLTSNDGVFDRARGKVVGSELYITKPFNMQTIMQPVQDYVLQH